VAQARTVCGVILVFSLEISLLRSAWQLVGVVVVAMVLFSEVYGLV
jgi:hypothetical protein